MSDLWLIDETVVETRLARLTGGRLVSVRHYPKIGPPAQQPRPGDVFAARAGQRRPAAGGAFLDLGGGLEGFVREKSASLPEGALIVASVVQAPIGSKAARLVLGIQLEGRYVHLSAANREDLKRTNVDAGPDLIERETASLQAQAAGLRERAGATTSPQRLASAPSAGRAAILRARTGDRIRIASARYLRDSKELAAEFAPGLLADIASGDADLFESEGAQSQIETALDPIVALSGGGRLVIEMTQALTAIDVDSAGARNVQEANLAAARAVPYEIAVRELSGTILVDFASVRERGILERLGDTIATGATELGIELDVGRGRRGLLDLRRARREAPLAAHLTQAGLTHLAVSRTLSPPAQAAELARRLACARPAARLDVRVAPAALAWLGGEGRAYRDAIAAGSPAQLRWIAANDLASEAFEIVEVR